MIVADEGVERLDSARTALYSRGEKDMRGYRTAWIALALTAVAAPAAAKEPKVGEPAPDFEVKLMDGTKVSLSELKGQVVVLNFWATWCVPCLHELPTLDAYYRARHEYGLRIFSVTTEGSLPNYRLKNVFADIAITPAKGIKGPYNDIHAVPTNYIIDRKGILRYAKAASFSMDDLNRLLKPLLLEPA